MTYAQQFALVDDSAFRGRIAMALVKAAQNIQTEPVETPNHAERLTYAVLILKNPGSMAWDFIYDVSSNVTIAAAGATASADGDLDFVIATVWNTKAGI